MPVKPPPKDTPGFPGDEGYNPDDWSMYKSEDLYVDNGKTLKVSDLKGEIRFIYRGRDSVVFDTGETADIFRFTNVETGEPCSIWSFYALARALEEVDTGDRISIEYLGTDELSNGRRIHRINVRRYV